MTYLIPSIIIALTIVAVTGVLLFRHLHTPKLVPFERVGGVRVRWLPDTERPWNGLEAVCALIVAEDLSDKVAIEVVPYVGLCISPTVPSGYITTSGQSTSGITAPHMRVTGTCRMEGSTVVLVVRQLRAGDSSSENLSANGDGELLPAGRTALLHELAQHAIPFLQRKSWNYLHEDVLARETEKRLRLRLAQLT